MEKVRIGFVGVGGMGQCAHLRNYATLPECQVVALAEVRPELAARVAAKYGVPRVYANHEELLAAEEVDGLVASQPFTRHGVLVPELLAAGRPVFTEKPISGSIAVGERIVAATAAAGTWHMVGYHKRSDPATVWAKERIAELTASGELGPLRYVRITMPAGDWIAAGFTDLLHSSEPLPPLTWDAPEPDLDEQGNKDYISFVNYYIHQVNLLRHLLGEPYRVTYAEPSGVLLAVQSASGVAGVIEMTPYQTTVDWQETALIAFEKGWLQLTLPAPLASNRPGQVELYRDPGGGRTPERITPTLPWVHAMRAQAANFCRAIRGEAPPPCDGREALEDLRVARQYLDLARAAKGAGA
ncbi:MAG: Gfo/Idh/MocA family oxidoreductase [Fimbriimonadaceae bacterium]|nr:Gfo/Idh/MocA family oxidoreductase [Fimbriimonadaceae bacterium]